MVPWLSLSLVYYSLLLWWHTSAAFPTSRPFISGRGWSNTSAAASNVRGPAITTAGFASKSRSSSSSSSTRQRLSSSKPSDNGDHSNAEQATTSTTSAATSTPSSLLAAADEKNVAYIQSLLDNLTPLLDKYILTGSAVKRDSIYNVLRQIESHARDPEPVELARRRIQRAGLPLPATGQQQQSKELGRTDGERRRQEAEQRRRWEMERSSEENGGRSALSRRSTANEKPDLFLGTVDGGLSVQQKLADDKVALESQMENSDRKTDATPKMNEGVDNNVVLTAANKVAEMVARAGAATGFDGQSLGIGGLDDVLAQVKRRIWTPLAAPPQLLRELGITPVRGLLLYGKPGCGKTLLAKKLGQLLSPLRPITVVSGPEIMDKFVGSSEMKLREIFDNPPDIFDFVRNQEPDHGEAIAQTALHVIIMDEFDAISRHRGGRGGNGDQGDAGVARDSVVNQLLAKMDGVAPLVVPTLVIGLTNKRSLIDAALLRPGRFEVQIEVPPPRTVEQRISILKVHTLDMHHAGRLLVRDAPLGSASARMATALLPSYDELLRKLAEETAGFSGASLAAMCRAAGSHALERAVEEFTQNIEERKSLLADCVVTVDDFENAKKDFENLDASDYDDTDGGKERKMDSPPVKEDGEVEI